MGGSGSGSPYHWWRGSKKDTVEDCRQLDANRWMREGILTAGVWQSGSWAWFRDAERKEQTASIDYQVNTLGAESWLRLTYTFTRTGLAIDHTLRLVTTRPRFGGLRWWFVCPLVVNGQPCNRRVGKLYLPPGGRYYGCRHCYRLTYRSCQEHDKRVDLLLREMGGFEAAFQRAMAEPRDARRIAKLGLLLKADREARRRWAE